MKKNIISILALVLALAALVLAVFTCLEVRLQNTRLDALEAQLQDLNTQLSAMQSPLPGTPDDTETGSSYCNLYLGDWTCEGSTLTLTTAFAQVVSTPGRTLTEASLRLELSGEASTSIPLSMNPGEASDSYELDLGGFPLELPSLTHGDHLNLYLDAVLSDGTALSVCGGSWDWENGKLLMIAG